MKKINSPTLITFFTENNSLLFSVITIFISFTLGAFFYCRDVESFNNFFNEKIELISKTILSVNFMKAFFAFALSDFLFMMLVTLFAISLVGNISVIFLTVFRTVGISSLFAYLYYEFGLKGAEFIVFILLAGTFVQVFSIMILTEKTIQTSVNIRHILNKKTIGELQFNKILSVNILSLMLLMLSAIIKTVCFKLFAGLFV